MSVYNAWVYEARNWDTKELVAKWPAELGPFVDGLHEVCEVTLVDTSKPGHPNL